MNLEPITWEKREPIQRLRRQYGHQSASHAFQSLYLWEKIWDCLWSWKRIFLQSKLCRE